MYCLVCIVLSWLSIVSSCLVFGLFGVCEWFVLVCVGVICFVWCGLVCFVVLFDVCVIVVVCVLLCCV